MSDSVINFKIDSNLKKQAQEVSARLGISLSAVLNNSLKKLVYEQEYKFQDYEIPSQYLIDSIETSLKEIKNGQYISFPSIEAAIEDLEKMIADEEN